MHVRIYFRYQLLMALIEYLAVAYEQAAITERWTKIGIFYFEKEWRQLYFESIILITLILISAN